MKWLACFLALVLLLPGSEDARAHCGVYCHQSAFIATQYAVAVGVPIAEAAPTYVSYSPTPNITINNNFDSAALGNAIAAGIVNGLNGPTSPAAQSVSPAPNAPATAPTQPTPPVPPQPKAASLKDSAGPSSGLSSDQNCLRCHNGTSAKATAAVDMTKPMTCQQKLASIRAVVAGSMPKDAPFGNTPADSDKAGKIITELSAP